MEGERSELLAALQKAIEPLSKKELRLLLLFAGAIRRP